MTVSEASLGKEISDRLASLDTELRKLESVLVAFSGGADSAFLLAAAVRTLGADHVVAATAVSPSLPAVELQSAVDFAVGLGVRHLTPGTSEMENSAYAANGRDRCFHCKAELLDVLIPLAAGLGINAVVTGTNADDARARFLPGIRAAALRGAVTPLCNSGMTKTQVRAISRVWGLSTADKPAAACLSSRVAYGISISPARLRRIEMAEADFRTAIVGAGLSVQSLRVRDLGGHASIEVDAALVAELLRRPELMLSISGFESVAIDPQGFRSGSMNDSPERKVD